MALQNNQFWPSQPAKMEEAPSLSGGSARVLPTWSITQRRLLSTCSVRRDQALEVVVGQAPVDAVIERCGRGIKISPDQGAPYAA
jgi:hypothetical protein